MRYSYGELEECARRELRMRKRVYSNRVLTHRMTQEQADRETAMMEAIADHFRQLARENEELALALP